jgi:hypothetical protein
LVDAATGVASCSVIVHWARREIVKMRDGSCPVSDLFHLAVSWPRTGEEIMTPDRDGINPHGGIDLEKFFDRVNHDVLMSRVARRIGGKRVLGLIRGFLRSRVFVTMFPA